MADPAGGLLLLVLVDDGWLSPTMAAVAVDPLGMGGAGVGGVDGCCRLAAGKVEGMATAAGGTVYGAVRCFRASRRSFFCCMINRRLSSLDLVLEFSSSAAHRWHWVAGPVGVSNGWPHLHWILTAVAEEDGAVDDAAAAVTLWQVAAAALLVMVPGLPGNFLVWIGVGIHRDTSLGLGAATGVVNVAAELVLLPAVAAPCGATVLLPLPLVDGSK